MFTFNGEDLEFQFLNYATNDAMAVSLVTTNGEPYTRLSVNVDEAAMARLPKGSFYLKDYSENTAVAHYLMGQHILTVTSPIVTALIAGPEILHAVHITKEGEHQFTPSQCADAYGAVLDPETGTDNVVCAYHYYF